MTRNGSPILLTRHRNLLALVDALGGTVGNLDFQKLLFLYCMEIEATLYDFVPYRFGAFSFASYKDRRTLVALGLLENDDRAWQLTTAGRQVCPDVLPDGDPRCAFVQRYQHLRGDALVAETYRRYPYYATRSEIAARVLGADRAALRRIEDVRPQGSSQPLTTIGYEGRSLDAYLNILLQARSTVLCDVRRNALSRKYGFSKSTLANACTGVGIRYEHLPQLGIASAERRGLESDADYAALFERYASHDLPQHPQALEVIRGWVAQGDRVTLTCFERSPDRCHRHCVAEELAARFGALFEPQHL